MPELPDITIYIEALDKRIVGRRLIRVTLRSPFLLRSADPPISAVENRAVSELRRIGKRIAIGLDGELWIVIHLMIAGRLHWKDKAPNKGGRNLLAVFEFESGWLWLTEAGTQRRAAIHVVRGRENLGSLDGGGIDVLGADLPTFSATLRATNHTLKRALTDPHILSGIGNAYSDEILHRARLSPIAMTNRITDEQVARLYAATQEILLEWIERLRKETDGEFPENVTAFHPTMAVHGRYRMPCPRCGAKIQRIRHAANETNYCPVCQTGGRLLADHAISRLLHEDWPRTIDALERRRQR
jgi:formamidopyrimidine-DNA glycosylase